MDHSSVPDYGVFKHPPDMARRRVAAPAIGLICLAIVGMLLGIVQAIGVIVTFCVLAADKGLPRAHEALQVYSVFGGGALGGLLGTGVYAVIFFGAWSMKNLQRRGLALAASVLAIIPCLSPCFILGIPLGIWALVVLSSHEVRIAFQQSPLPPHGR